MTFEEFHARFPRLYHMAHCGSWESIFSVGLLSTSSLVEVFQVPADQRNAIEECRRAHIVPISHPVLGDAYVRDQKPLRLGALSSCLDDGLTTRQWLRLLNTRVFFWPSERRLTTMLSARTYREHHHDVLVLSTEQLNQEDLVLEVSKINSGATLYRPPKRGLNTFCALSDFPSASWAKVVEICIRGGLANVERHCLEVFRMRSGQQPELLWARGADA